MIVYAHDQNNVFSMSTHLQPKLTSTKLSSPLIVKDFEDSMASLKPKLLFFPEDLSILKIQYKFVLIPIH